MDNPFDSPRILLQEAKEHIARVELGAEAFLNNKGNIGGTEVDPKSGEILLYVQFASGIPMRINMDVKAAARDLRDALDHAVYASAVVISGGDPEKTKFLVADTTDGIQQAIKRRTCKDVHEDIIALMVKEDACETGNPTIWTLNKLRNRDTHKVISAAHLTSEGFKTQNGIIDAEFTLISEWRTTRNRVYFARCSAKSQFHVEIGPTLAVCFNRALNTSREPASTFLHRAADEVERIIGDIEKETLRIIADRP